MLLWQEIIQIFLIYHLVTVTPLTICNTNAIMLSYASCQNNSKCSLRRDQIITRCHSNTKGEYVLRRNQVITLCPNSIKHSLRRNHASNRKHSLVVVVTFVQTHFK